MILKYNSPLYDKHILSSILVGLYPLKGDEDVFTELAKHSVFYKKLVNNYVKNEKSILVMLIETNRFPTLLKLIELGLVDFSKRDKDGGSILSLVAISGRGHILKAMLSYISDKELPYSEWCGDIKDIQKYNVEMYTRMDENIYRIANMFPELLGGVLIMTPEKMKNTHEECNYLREILLALLAQNSGKDGESFVLKTLEYLHSFTDNIDRINHPIGKLLFVMDGDLASTINVGFLNGGDNKKMEKLYTVLSSRLESEELKGLVNVVNVSNKENKI